VRPGHPLNCFSPSHGRICFIPFSQGHPTFNPSPVFPPPPHFSSSGFGFDTPPSLLIRMCWFTFSSFLPSLFVVSPVSFATLDLCLPHFSHLFFLFLNMEYPERTRTPASPLLFLPNSTLFDFPLANFCERLPLRSIPPCLLALLVLPSLAYGHLSLSLFLLFSML